MKDIMIATSNLNKVREYTEMLEPLGYKVHDLREIEHIEPDENGTTYAENAIIKASAIYERTNMMVISDDSGLAIDFYHGGPGIHSARFLEGHDYTYKNNYILNEMKDSKERGALFTCAICLIDEQGTHIFQGELKGNIAYEIKGEHGFGYDPIFIPEGYNISNAQFLPEEKNKISHRGQATRQLLEYLRSK